MYLMTFEASTAGCTTSTGAGTRTSSVHPRPLGPGPQALVSSGLTLQRASVKGIWHVRDRKVDLHRPVVFGIVNVTPDSFSDGGRYLATDAALAHAERLVQAGAEALDIGGESTRPGAEPVSMSDERRRVLPVVQEVRKRWPNVIVSIDTTKSEIAAEALDAGADVVNDVSGFRLDPQMGEICAAREAGVILMHSRGGVRDMATFAHATYDDVVSEVLTELDERIHAAMRMGVRHDRIAIDPGVGFSKRPEQSLTVLGGLPRMVELGYPVMVGASRKRFVGEITGVQEPEQRVAGSIGAHVAALALGARLFRVHDVHETRQALDVAWQILRRTEAVPA